MQRMAKVMISLPNDLLERVDREAAQRNTTRSAFLQEAAQRALGHPDPGAVDAALARSRARFARAGPFESAELIREERDELSSRR